MNKIINGRNRDFIIIICVFVAAVILLFSVGKASQQSKTPFTFPLTFDGEYRQGDGQWEKYEPGMKFSALKGDLHLRGNFTMDMQDVEGVLLYSNHIVIDVFKNGEKVYSNIPDFELTPETNCIKQWNSWFCSGIASDDVIEFILHNPHKAGNAEAYNDFLSSLYIRVPELVDSRIMQFVLPDKAVAVALLAVSAVIMGVAAGFSLMNRKERNVLWPLGIMIAFMGGYIWLDTQCSVNILFRQSIETAALRVCIMVAAFELSEIVCSCLTENKKLHMMTLALALFDTGLFAAASMGMVLIYDTLLIWMIVQTAVFGVLIMNGIYVLKTGGCVRRPLLVTGILMMISVIVDFVNSFFIWWPQGVLSKAIFIILTTYHLLVTVKTVPAQYRAAAETKQLRDELKNSRIILALSQIRTHFIFNVLNSISGLCQYDPDEASRAVSHFAKYLRGNINVLQDDELICFKSELSHLEDYIVLEQIRFGERVTFEKQLGCENFLIPPLVLQPIVENSIKHGLLRRKEGGRVLLTTEKRDGKIIIEIIDNGIGFDSEKPVRKGAVGMDNVKFRLEYMIGGSLSIESRPDEGTKVIIQMPYKTE